MFIIHTPLHSRIYMTDIQKSTVNYKVRVWLMKVKYKQFSLKHETILPGSPEVNSPSHEHCRQWIECMHHSFAIALYSLCLQQRNDACPVLQPDAA